MATARTSISSYSSSVNTELDYDSEAVRSRTRVSHLDLVFDPSGVTWEVLEKEYVGRGTHDSPFIVEFLPEDPHNPFLFPNWKKWMITMLQAFATFAIAFTSSAYSGGIVSVIQEFHASQETAILGVSLFVFGFAIGPLLWAPLSEFYGRQLLFFVTYLLMTIFNAASAAAPNMSSLLALRFFAGAFGSSPLTNSGGVIADMFNASERGFATALFAVAPFLGPSLGPVIGGFMGQTGGWRWVLGLTAIFTGVVWIACVLLVPETYGPILLRRRAAMLTKLTGKVYISKLDAHEPKTMQQQFKAALLRPWVLLFREPIVLLTALYMAILYGTMYLLIAAYPIVFQANRGWSPGVGGLPFLGIAAGMLVAVAYAMHDNKRYRAVVVANDGAAPPESRLPIALLGSVLLPIGLFIFAWTNGPEVHWFIPVVAGGIFAAGMVLVFLSLLNYLIDSYVVYAASVLAANSVLRSLFGAMFPLFTTNMYRNLGIHWASTVPAFLALACMPFPFLFYKYGADIRKRCKWAAEAAAILERMRSQRKIQAVAQAKRAASRAGTRTASVRSYVRSEAPQLRWTLENLRWVDEDDESEEYEAEWASMAGEEDRTPYRLSRIPYFPSLTL